MMADRRLNVLYNYFDFSDEQVEPESFAMVMRYLMQFEKIVVFYGKFKSILVQEVEGTVLSGEDIEKQVAREVEVAERYLFEPNVVEMARIFEGEILASVFEQALHESQLAKFASRMLNLDRAIVNIDRRLMEVGREQRKLRHKEINSKQLLRLSGIGLWR